MRVGTENIRATLRDGNKAAIVGASRQIGRKQRMVVFFDQRGVSVYHKNIAHCMSNTSLNRNSNTETYADTINICSIC